MTQYQLTLDPTVLQRLFTSSDGQLAHLLEAILNQVLEAQMSCSSCMPCIRDTVITPEHQTSTMDEQGEQAAQHHQRHGRSRG